MARTKGARSTVVKADNVARKQAWQTMRIMRRFTRGDVLTTAAIAKSNLDKYVRALIATEFLEVAQERLSGRPGSRDVLRMRRDNGPRPPLLHKDGSVTDPNTGERWYVEADPATETEVGDA